MKAYKKPFTSLIVLNDADEIMVLITSIGGEGTGHEPDTKRQDLNNSSIWDYFHESDSDL